jgi:ankyrin repeat protein
MAGVNIESKDEDSNTPLIVAAEWGQLAVVKLLLKVRMSEGMNS